MDQIETGFLRNPNSSPVLLRQAGRAGKFQISENYWKIIDRKEALKKAISLAKPGDVVVSTGMGSQKWFYGPKGSKIPWDEPKIVEEILNSN
jgi:UDP-N-acetylmuramyl tripeptide synthase